MPESRNTGAGAPSDAMIEAAMDAFYGDAYDGRLLGCAASLGEDARASMIEAISAAMNAHPPAVALSALSDDEVGAPYGIIDPDYARVFTKARAIAWQEGYAILMHGSFTRDLDLLAVAWTDRACEPEHLVRRIEAATELKNISKAPGEKAHGRLAWTLVFPAFGDPRFLDLSVIPPRAAAALRTGPAACLGDGCNRGDNIRCADGECDLASGVARTAPAEGVADLVTALTTAHEAIVLTIAFLGRDAGTDRLPRTIDQLIEILVKADTASIAALKVGVEAAPPAAPDAGAGEVTDA